MDRTIREDRYAYRRERENPSFSSTLLDAIYRSIDEGEEELVLYRETMRKTRSNSTALKDGGIGGFQDDVDVANIRRACIIDKWMEKKVSEKVVVRRKSAADFEMKSRNDRDSLFLNSSSSSSDSSSGGGFSSSEAESVLYAHKPKPIRTSVSRDHEKFNNRGIEHNVFEKKPKLENSFVKTKSKAMKIYGDLKKAKQPISPGGKLASFLNSIFTAGSAKKAKISSSDTMSTESKSKSAYASTCSSASSFSRSCLSKTPSSRGKSSNGTKRSVRFCPVSVIVGEDCQPCGHKSLPEPRLEVRNTTLGNSINEVLKLTILEKNRRVEEAARDLLKNYQKKVEYQFNMRNVEDDEDDDAASYASSDLFELDNLSSIGIERYREELPVYETTHLGTNRAIANGLIS